MTDKENNTDNNNISNKIQVRARILSAIVNLQKNSHDLNYIRDEINELKNITDKSSVMNILLKEFLKENPEIKDYTISFLMKNLIEQEEKQKVLFECLANPKISDKLKTKILSLLREDGKHINYEEYTKYFENPDSIIDADTEKLLENAKINPESQIDFLDFLTSLPISEKKLLINSLEEDYDGDNLANILIPVILSNPYSESAQIAINAIGTSRSPLAYPVLEQLLETVNDPKVKSNLQKSLSMLKLSGIKEDITQEYYKKLLNDSPVFNCSISFPDGHGNIGLIFSRINQYGYIRMFALVFNDIDGIIDCFGFNEISKNEFSRILSKFYNNNEVASISADLAKYLMVSAENLTRKLYDEIPYEYIIWKNITNDIDYKEINISKNLKRVEVFADTLEQLYLQPYFNTWFMTENDNEKFTDILRKLENEKISDTYSISLILNSAKPEIFDKDFLKILNDRLVKCAYFAMINQNHETSSILYSLSFDGELKERFLTDYLKKSVYQYFLAQRDKYTSLKQSTSIFTRKSQLNEIDINYVELCIKNIENTWV